MAKDERAQLDIIATVSADRADARWVRDFLEAGATYFRINGAFESPDSIRLIARNVQKHARGKASLWLDIPRNKMRVVGAVAGTAFEAGQDIEFRLGDVNFPEFFSQIKKGDALYAKDSRYRFRVKRAGHKSALVAAEQAGQVTHGMGLHRLGGWDGLPLFSEKDERLLELAHELKIQHLGISYLRHAAEIPLIRKRLGPSMHPIFKIETYHAYEELGPILGLLKTISVDRGDLSSEIGIENIPAAVRTIAREARARGRKVFLATQFLQNMVTSPLPSISEVSSLYEAFELGIDGIQLSEETARGAFPLESLRWLRKFHADWSGRKPGRDLRGAVLWMTGLPGSGKTTLATALAEKLEQHGLKPCLLDGDEVRAFYDGSFGYDRAGRTLNQRNLIFLAHRLAQQGLTVIVASVSPYAQLRRLARERIPRYLEIYVRCPLKECMRRDPKGHYARARAGSERNFVGVSQGYDKPAKPDLIIDTEKTGVETSLRRLADFLKLNGA